MLKQINYNMDPNKGNEGLPLTRQNWFVCCKGEKGCYNRDTSAWAVLKESWFNFCTIFPHELFFSFGVAPSGTCKWSRVSAKKVFSGSISSKKVLHTDTRGVAGHNKNQIFWIEAIFCIFHNLAKVPPIFMLSFITSPRFPVSSTPPPVPASLAF